MTRPTSPPHPLVTTTAELRIPTQQRGTRRVEAILDAAAELVTEVGVEGLTVQLLAERAQTSKGSLYHFFPDVPSVLRALADRHLGEINAITQSIVHDESIAWRALSPQEVVAKLLAPLDYLEHNCDLLALTRAPNILAHSARSIKPMAEFVTRVLAARYPEMSEERRMSRAAMIVAVSDGVVAFAARGCTATSAGMRRELEELLTSYISALD